ncbi:hypothetical protein ACTQ1Z_03900 [Parolsenella sp. LCP21S3_E11]|uniref:hypothetical protein n=1 Tax=Parolsenella sp. LCP21S3_E11 TaxID=3438797 RepID=UPI003F9998EB
MIAPIQLDDLFLVSSSFQVADCPAEHMDQKIGLDFTVKQLERSGSEGLVALNLTVKTSLVDHEHDDEEKLQASVEVLVSAHASLPTSMTDEQADEYLLSNAISMAYGHAKTCIMTVSGLSPAGPVMIPAILPLDIVRDYLSGGADTTGV